MVIKQHSTMKKLTTLFSVLFLFVLSGCNSGHFEENSDKMSNTPVVETLPDLTAGFADEEQARTYIENNRNLYWHEADMISTFYGTTCKHRYQFNGETGDNSGTFSLVASDEPGTGNPLDAIYAIYPYDVDAAISDAGVLSLTLPAVQHYAEHSFGKGANTMIAVTRSVEDTFLSFKNACGYLKLKLYHTGGKRLRSVEVKGNAEEQIAGAATATIAFGGVPALVVGDEATTTVTLDCGEAGIALGTTAETATELWIVLPETTFKKGITITATDTTGDTFEKSTSNRVVITRNTIQPMAALDVEFAAPLLKPANNEIWYTTTNGEPLDLTESPLYEKLASHVYEGGKGVLTFASDVTTLDAVAFFRCENLTSVTLPECVTAIGMGAFYCCCNLSHVTIPASVAAIGQAAFYECEALEEIDIPSGVTEIPDQTFNGCISLTRVGIPESVEQIGWRAFSGCEKLTEVVIPDHVVSIGDEAFSECWGLVSVTIGNSVESIGEWAFLYCDLTEVTIPASVKEIKSMAFKGCRKLASYYCESPEPPLCGDRLFEFNDQYVDFRIYVPIGCGDAYKAAAGWSIYADRIVEMTAL